MSIKKDLKKEVISKFANSENDTGSPEFQIALLTKRIILLTGHLKQHAHDYSTRRGLLKTVGKRRKLLDYLKRKDVLAYRKLVKDLKLRR